MGPGRSIHPIHEPIASIPTPQQSPIQSTDRIRWTFDFLDLVLLGFVKSEVVKDLSITERDEAWMLGVSLGTSGFGASSRHRWGGPVGLPTHTAYTPTSLLAHMYVQNHPNRRDRRGVPGGPYREAGHLGRHHHHVFAGQPHCRCVLSLWVSITMRVHTPHDGLTDPAAVILYFIMTLS